MVVAMMMRVDAWYIERKRIL